MPYTTDWKRVDEPRHHGKDGKCESPDLWYREWESSDGGHEDYEYECRHCGKTWWVDGVDS